MSITPEPSLKTCEGRFKHGSVLSGNIGLCRVSSQWKSTLNQVRSAEERRGFIKWLRPDYQIDKVGPLAHRGDRVQAILAAKTKKKGAFPAARSDQARVVLDLMARAKSPLSAEEIAASFTSADQTIAEIRDVLKSLARLGQADSYDNGRSFFRAA